MPLHEIGARIFGLSVIIALTTAVVFLAINVSPWALFMLIPIGGIVLMMSDM